MANTDKQTLQKIRFQQKYMELVESTGCTWVAVKKEYGPGQWRLDKEVAIIQESKPENNEPTHGKREENN